MTKGYYVITPTEHIWCHNKACAKETSRDLGGYWITEEEYDKQFTLQVK